MKIINKIMCVIGWITTICLVALLILYSLYRLWLYITVQSVIATWFGGSFIVPIIILVLVITVIVLAVMLSKKSKKKDTPYSPFYNK
jgi:uncharacterized membrane protein